MCLSHTAKNLCESRASSKGDVFKDVIFELGTLIEDGYGFTMTEIREMTMNKDESLELYNRDVKKLLTDYYGDNMQFVQATGITNPRCASQLI